MVAPSAPPVEGEPAERSAGYQAFTSSPPGASSRRNPTARAPSRLCATGSAVSPLQPVAAAIEINRRARKIPCLRFIHTPYAYGVCMSSALAGWQRANPPSFPFQGIEDQLQPEHEVGLAQCRRS